MNDSGGTFTTPRTTWVRHTAFGERLTAVALIFVGIVAALVVAGGMSLKISNGVRAYVAGEGLWSRGQKDAVFALERYADSGDPNDFAQYQRALEVNMGDRQARLELEKQPDYNWQVAFIGFQRGGNNPADIPDMIYLFRHFRKFSYLDEAIRTWERGDLQIDSLRGHADELKAAVEGNAPRGVIVQLLADIRHDNDGAAVLELSFSRTLSSGARWIHETLWWLGLALTAAMLVMGLILARRTAIVLNQRVEFETLVARVSSLLTTLTPSQVDAGINNALGDLGRFAEVDRSYVFSFDETYAYVGCTHEWCAPGVTSQIQRLQHLRVADFPWVEGQLQRGQIVHVPRLYDLPLEAENEREEWEHESIRSLLLVPTQAGGTVRGYVGFDSVRSEKYWPTETQDLLRLFGEIVVNTQERVKAETALRARNAELNVTVAELARSNAELEEFAYAASHDLKTPLRAISGFIQLLARRLKGKLEPEAEEYIALALHGVDQMHALIAGVLAMSRIGKADPEQVEVKLDGVLDEVLVTLAPVIKERNVEVVREPLPVVQGTPVEMQQLFQNLIANAIKFQPGQAPKVEIGAVRDGDWWVFRVRDQGIGIDPQHHQKIFQIFQRLHPSEVYEGSGIGLSICRKVVQRHGGRIWVESELGKGTTFFFTLKA